MRKNKTKNNTNKQKTNQYSYQTGFAISLAKVAACTPGVHVYIIIILWL